MRSLHIFPALLWRAVLSRSRDPWHIFFYLIQLLLWAILAQSANRPSSDGAPGGIRLADMAAMALLLTAIGAGILSTRDRRNGLLKAMISAPAPRSLIVLGLVLPGFLLSLFSGLVPYLFGLPQALTTAVAPLALLSFVSTAVAICLALWLDSTEAYLAASSGILLLLLIGIFSGRGGRWNLAAYALALVCRSEQGIPISLSDLIYPGVFAIGVLLLLRKRLIAEGSPGA